MPDNDPAVAGPHGQQRASKRDRWWRKESKQGIVINAIVAACAVGGLVFLVIQYQFMVESNRLTRESNEASDRIANRTLRLMEESNRLTRESNRITRDAVEESKRQAEANRSQSAKDAAASLGMARESLKESRRALETSQRARLIVERYEVSGNPPVATVYIKNTGALPATNVRWSVDLMMHNMSPTIPKPEDIMSPNPLRSRVTIGADISYRIVTSPLPPQERGDLRFLYGLVGYSDGFGHERSLEFCYFQNVVNNQWVPCFYRNTVD